MVTLKHISETIDKSKENEATVDIYELAEIFKLNLDWVNQERLKGYWIGGWNCTDTRVGYVMYFLDDEAVGLSIQTARKSDKEYEWFGEDSAEKVFNFLLSLTKQEMPKLNYADLNEDVGIGYTINYNSQIVHGTNAIFNGEDVEVTGKILEDNFGIDTLVEIKTKNGVKTADIRELNFKYNLQKQQNKFGSWKLKKKEATKADLELKQKYEDKLQRELEKKYKEQSK